MPDGTSQEDENALVISCKALRLLLGGIGLALPFAILFGAGVLAALGRDLPGGVVQSSIRAYYCTPLSGILIGALCAIGVFLLSYTGYAPRTDLGERLHDRPIGVTAGVSAILVALIPTSSPTAATACTLGSWVACLLDAQTVTLAGKSEPLFAVLHYAAVAVFFVTTALFCLRLFTRTGSGAPPAPGTRKALRNRIYVVCGWAIVAALVALAFFFVLPTGGALQSALGAVAWVFWCEAAGVVAFGAAWLVKSDAIAALRDVSSR